MSLKFMRVTVLIALLSALVGLACSVPQILTALPGGEDTETQPPGGTPTATRSETSAYPYPPQPTPAYPGAEEPTLPIPTPYPGVTLEPEVTSAYPAPDSGSPTATPVLAATATPTPAELYPGPGGETPTTALPYPGPEGTASPTAIIVLTGTPSATPTNPYPAPGAGATPTPTEVLAGATPTGTLIPLATPTPLPTVTLSATPTPLPSPTPFPPPPWVSSNLSASDPSTVKLASGRVQLIWFFAFWDGPSQAMAPLVHGLEAQYEAQMNFIYLDIDDPATKSLKERLGYRTQPQFTLLDPNGIELRQWLRYVSVAEFQAAFEEALR